MMSGASVRSSAKTEAVPCCHFVLVRRELFIRDARS